MSAGEDTYRHLRIFEDVVSLISNNYVENVDLDDVMHGALRGLTDGLDSDSAFLAAEDVERIQQGAPLPAGDVGLTVTRRYYLQVVAAMDGSPAANAGFLPGDFVRAIDGEPTRFMSAVEGERRLHGVPGSTVTVSLIRGSTQEPYDIALVRTRLDTADVAHRMLAGTIGYLRVPAFHDTIAARIAQATADLTAQGATEFIVDVRNTAGGDHAAALDAARLFVEDGTLVVREDIGGARTPLTATPGRDVLSAPTTLLTNFGTSGPAELFVAGLAELDRVTTVGQRTAGRTGVQTLVPLPDGTGLWLSSTRYLRASGDPIHRYGVEPDVPVEIELPELGEPLPASDPVLERALEVVAEQAARSALAAPAIARAEPAMHARRTAPAQVL